MTKPNSSHPIAALVPEAELDSFLANDFERRPAWFDRCATQDHGFDLETFFTTLRDTVWPPKALSLVPDDLNMTSPQLLAKMVTKAGRFSLDRIRATRAQKATIVVVEYQRFHQGMRQFINAINKSGFYSAKANMYFTPSHAQGFIPHWDTHDVFVLQISGEKEWHLADSPGIENPTSHDAFKMAKDHPLEVEKTVRTLKAGEMLYIPRGYGHYAKALDSDSLHITIGLFSVMWYKVLEDLAEKLFLECPSLRTSLVTDVSNLDPETLDCSPIMDELANVTPDMIRGLVAEKLARRQKFERENFGQTFGSSLDDLMK